ncbi:hypothetical protein [Kitasatospora sp. DSM 101779]|uniref:hypothetical protein n=1 Tax=Kitasatospora sp. DSM 101779 TaxID=2853165 RepID=UPI0021DA0C06|nr:hypothetical protein [Kitasatospora sp. DSM 101779]MCU7827094.1 hypothetical protein [Kitasatospora sp. DSM 101779]
MITALLLAVLVLTVGGSVCVVWADRGGPRWVRGVASVTLAVGELVRESEKKRLRKARKNMGDINSSSGDGGGGD